MASSILGGGKKRDRVLWSRARAASTEIKGMERGEKGGTRVVHESVRENVARRHGRLNKRPSLYLHRRSVCVRVRARVFGEDACMAG